MQLSALTDDELIRTIYAEHYFQDPLVQELILRLDARLPESKRQPLANTPVPTDREEAGRERKLQVFGL